MHALKTLLFCVVGLMAGGALAQTTAYPAKPITLVLPVAAGSSGDTAFRVLAEKMYGKLGQPLVLENTTGAAGLIGIERGRRAPPDGYTLLGGNDSGLIYLPLLNKNATYDPRKDFEPITQVADIEWVLVVNPAFPAQTVADLIKLAKERPGKIDYASGGPGSPQQVIMELFKKRAGIDLMHVPYKGATPALTDVVSGTVAVGFQGIAVAKPYLQNGRLRALATTGLTRSVLLPDVPTVAESGFPGFEYHSWVGLLFPANTSREQVNVIHEAAVAALADPAVRASFAASGLTPVGNTPEQFRKNLVLDYSRLSDLVNSIGLKIE